MKKPAVASSYGTIYNHSDPILLYQRIDGNEARFSLRIPDNLIYFEGHFPGYPILPGVAQIKWVVELAERLPLSGDFSMMTKLKFMRLMTPGKRITLYLTASPSDKSLDFRFHDDDGDYSCGQLVFK